MKNFQKLSITFITLCLIIYYISIDFIYLINIIIFIYLLLLFINNNNFFIKKNLLNNLFLKYINYSIIYIILIRFLSSYFFRFFKKINIKNFFILLIITYLIKYSILKFIKYFNFSIIKNLIFHILNIFIKIFYNFNYIYYILYYLEIIIDYLFYSLQNILIIFFIFIYINYIEIIPFFYNIQYNKFNKINNKFYIFNIEKFISNIFFFYVKKKDPIQYNSLKNYILLNQTSQILFHIIEQNDGNKKISFSYPYSIYFYFYFFKYICLKKKIINFKRNEFIFKIKNNIHNLNILYNKYIFNQKIQNKKINFNNILLKKINNKFNHLHIINKSINILSNKYKFNKLYKKKYKYIYNKFLKQTKIKFNAFKSHEIKYRKFKRIKIISFSDIFKNINFQESNNTKIYLIQYYNYVDFSRYLIKGMSSTKNKKTSIKKIIEKNINSLLFHFVKYKKNNIQIQKKNKYLTYLEINDYLSDLIPFIYFMKSILLLIQLYFRKYIRLPILIIFKNFLNLFFFKSYNIQKNINNDFKKLKNEIYIYCNWNGIELSKNKIVIDVLFEGIQIKILFSFNFDQLNNFQEKNEKFLNLWGNLIHNNSKIYRKKQNKNYLSLKSKFFIIIIKKKIILKFIYIIKYIKNNIEILIIKKKLITIKKNVYQKKKIKNKIIFQYFLLYKIYKNENNFIKFKNKNEINNLIFYSFIKKYKKIKYQNIQNIYPNKSYKILNIFKINLFINNKLNNWKFNNIILKKFNINLNILIYQIQFRYFFNLKIIKNIKIYCFYIKYINKKLLISYLKTNKIDINILINFENYFTNITKNNYFIYINKFKKLKIKNELLIKYQFIKNYYFLYKNNDKSNIYIYYILQEIIYINKHYINNYNLFNKKIK